MPDRPEALHTYRRRVVHIDQPVAKVPWLVGENRVVLTDITDDLFYLDLDTVIAGDILNP